MSRQHAAAQIQTAGTSLFSGRPAAKEKEPARPLNCSPGQIRAEKQTPACPAQMRTFLSVI